MDSRNFSDFSELGHLQDYLNKIEKKNLSETQDNGNILTGGGCGCGDSNNVSSTSVFEQAGGARRSKKSSKKSKKSKKSRKMSRTLTSESASSTTELSLTSDDDDDSTTEASSDSDYILSEGNNFKVSKNPKINVVPFYSSESTSENYQHLQTKNRFL
jgi:hypothetical protein